MKIIRGGMLETKANLALIVTRKWLAAATWLLLAGATTSQASLAAPPFYEWFWITFAIEECTHHEGTVRIKPKVYAAPRKTATSSHRRKQRQSSTSANAIAICEVHLAIFTDDGGCSAQFCAGAAYTLWFDPDVPRVRTLFDGKTLSKTTRKKGGQQEMLARLSHLPE